MTDPALRRFIVITAGLSAGTYAIVAALLADAPPIQADGATVLAWVRPHRTVLLVAAYLWGLSVAAILAFLTGVWAKIAQIEGPRPVLATLGLGAGFATFILSLVGFASALALAWLVDSIGAETAKLLNSLALLPVALTGIPTALTILPWVAVARTHAKFPAALSVFSVVVAGLHIVSAGAFADAGLLSPSGVGVLVAPPAYYVWVVWMGVWCWKTPD